jgi:microcystin-dependent protein
MKIKSLIATVSLSACSLSAWSQVGIGVASPNANSILDLTNSNNKGLLLPRSSTAPTAGTYPEGMLFYYDSMVYVRNATGFNGITPWKYRYNGSTNEVIYFNPTSYIGVGIGVNDVSIRGNFHVSLNSKEVSVTGTSAAIFVGNSDAVTHMLIDNDEIMVKTNTTTGGILKLQEGGGSVQVGQSITNTSNINVYGKVKENGNDLLPQGVVVMWSGSLATIPAGWALCDGLRYQINTTTGLTEVVGVGGFLTPDLRERFIVGAGSSDNGSVAGTIQYSPGPGGGLNEVTLTAAQIPAHNHGVNLTTSPNGAHSHTYDKSDNCYDIVASGQSGCWLLVPGSTVTNTSTTPNHTHSVTGNTDNNTGGGSAHENRPPYYALAFIIKL